MNKQPESFEEFTHYMMRDLFSALLKEGSEAMRIKLYIWLPYFLTWNKEVKKKVK